MNYSVSTTRHFDRSFRKLRRARPDLNAKVDQVIRDLASDPYQPHLRLHALHGDLSGRHAVSVTYSHRIVLTLIVSERGIVLLDIGTHDEVYR